MSKPFQIAIDGPVAAGKGTVSKLVADRLGFFYVDTGAMYRTAAYLAQQAELDLADGPAVAQLIDKVRIEMHNPTEEEKDGRLTTVIVDSQDISWKIRTEQVSAGASQVAVHPQVRAVLVKKQQLIAQDQPVVMEGRDITYRVLPEAELKIYLKAGPLVRAKRRQFELQIRGETTTYDEVYQDLLKRDQQDESRKTDPLKVVEDAWVIDSSDLTIQQVVDLIVAKVNVMLDKRET